MEYQRNIHVIAPAVMTACGNQDKEITQLREDEHIRIQEAIQRWNLRLRELEEDRVRLRKKSLLMDVEIKRLESRVTQACLADKPRMTRQDTNGHTTALEDFRREFMTLLPWLRPHLTKCNNEGSAPHEVERVASVVVREIEECPWTRLEGELESCTDGATT